MPASAVTTRHERVGPDVAGGAAARARAGDGERLAGGRARAVDPVAEAQLRLRRRARSRPRTPRGAAGAQQVAAPPSTARRRRDSSRPAAPAPGVRQHRRGGRRPARRGRSGRAAPARRRQPRAVGGASPVGDRLQRRAGGRCARGRPERDVAAGHADRRRRRAGGYLDGRRCSGNGSASARPSSTSTTGGRPRPGRSARYRDRRVGGRVGVGGQRGARACAPPRAGARRRPSSPSAGSSTSVAPVRRPAGSSRGRSRCSSVISLRAARSSSAVQRSRTRRRRQRRRGVGGSTRGVAGRPPAARPRVERSVVGPAPPDLERDPRARVAPVVQPVVDQAGVAADRDPAARGVEVGLGRDGVLVVAEAVADVGEQLDQRDLRVGRVALGPVRERAAPAGRASAAGSSRSPWPGSRCRLGGRRRRRTRSAAPQSNVLGQPTLNEKRDRRQRGSKPAGGRSRRRRRDQPQRVGREVAGAVDRRRSSSCAVRRPRSTTRCPRSARRPRRATLLGAQRAGAGGHAAGLGRAAGARSARAARVWSAGSTSR